MQFEKTIKFITKILCYSSTRYNPINTGKEPPCISISSYFFSIVMMEIEYVPKGREEQIETNSKPVAVHYYR